ncbi:TPM domain-containing protein [Mesorhizobium sp. YR577]|uniref:TPM domain-containing protein n=1 Tax=Mesorhizobium sp. YR577 TaxID=1884373 RepID=UPI0008DF3052|nr:TPM domain-containing protein [Mesorhizobium sp. YR577]SFT40387.1 putative membrane protein [Mesorhizobium sp. YR577]
MRTPVQTMSAEDHARIAEAIRAAEKDTAGEIYCVVARSSDSYFFPAGFMILATILILSLAVAFGLEYWWVSVRAPVFVAAQLLAAASALILLWLVPSARILLVPRGLRYRRAHDNASKQFLARNVHLTSERTGVLIFVSLAERYAAVVADAGINQHVPQEAWDDVIRELTAHARQDRLPDGFVRAIATVGSMLVTHFPISSGDVNELDDHLVEI